MSARGPFGNVVTGNLWWGLIFFFFTGPNVKKTIKSCFSMLSKHPDQTFIHQTKLRLPLSKDCLGASFFHAVKWSVIPGPALFILDQVSHCAVSNYGNKNLVHIKELPTRVYKNCCRVKKKLKRWRRIKATSSVTQETFVGQESLPSTHFQVVVVRNATCVCGRREGNIIYANSSIIASPLS